MNKILKIIFAVGIVALGAISCGRALAITDIYGGGTGLASTTQGDLLIGTSSLESLCILHVGSNGAVLTASSSAPCGITWNQFQGLNFAADGTTISSTVSLGTTIFSLINTGNWAGTWQNATSGTYYPSSNPSGYLAATGTPYTFWAWNATGNKATSTNIFMAPTTGDMTIGGSNDLGKLTAFGATSTNAFVIAAQNVVLPYLFDYPITISANASGTQTNFPLLVSSTLPQFATAANGGDFQNTNGYDHIYSQSSACTSPLNYENEAYTSSTGALVDWVNVPSISAGTVIYMCFDNASVSTSQQSPSSTWNSNFTGVYHLATSPTGTLQTYDSTANANNGTNYLLGVPGAGVTATSSGYIDGSGSFQSINYTASSSYIKLSQNQNLPVYSSTTPYSISFWLNGTEPSSQAVRVFSEGNNATNTPFFSFSSVGSSLSGTRIYLGLRNASNTFLINNVSSTAAVFNGVWHQITWTDNLGTTTLYVDGVPDPKSFNYTPSGNFPFNEDAIGAFIRTTALANYNGAADEFEFSKTNLSPSWVATEYNNQSNPSAFYTIGTIGVPVGLGTYASISASGTISTAGNVSAIGAFMSGRSGTPGCFEPYDAVNSTTKDYVYWSNLVQTVTTTKPSFCQ